MSLLIVALVLGNISANSEGPAVMLTRTFHQGPGLGCERPGPGQGHHSQKPGQGPGFEYKDQDKDKDKNLSKCGHISVNIPSI